MIASVPPQTFSSLAEATARLSCSLVAFYLLGGIAARAARGLWFDATRASAVHRILLGQLVLCGWLLARSFVNFCIHAVVPLTAIDVVLVGVLMWLLHRQGSPFRELLIRPNAVVIFILIAVVGRVAWLELPRTIMLSSDPDQHAFMLAQALRLQTIPYFSQFDWGTTSFGYPEGFVTLNLAWALTSGLDPRDVVQMQPVVQCVLAALVLLEVVLETSSSFKIAGAAAAVVFLFFRALPYGYQEQTYHLEGAGRTSALSSIALILSCILATRLGRGGSKPDLLVVAASLTLIEITNITLVPMTALLAIAVVILRALSSEARIKTALSGLAALAAALALGFMSPWLLAKVLHVDVGRHIEHFGAPDQTSARAVVERMLSSVDEWLQLFNPGPLTWTQGLVWLGGTTSLLLVLARGNDALRRALAVAVSMWAAIAVLLVPMTVLATVLSRAFSSTGGFLGIYLANARMQLVWLVMVLTGVLLIRAVADSISNFALATIPFALLLAFKPIHIDLHRQKDPGANEGLTTDDLKVVDDLVAMKLSWGNRADPPVILLPNAPVIVNDERWLLPVGAGRILPLANTFPVAFYYFQGSNDYSWENYNERVCKHLDVEWLAARRITLMFAPEVPGCVDFVADQWKVVSRHGASVLYELRPNNR